jgi:hypothetical protein
LCLGVLVAKEGDKSNRGKGNNPRKTKILKKFSSPPKLP